MNKLDRPFQKQRGEYPKISAMVCALNEEGSLPYILRKIPDFVDEVIVVDGHSRDNTVAAAKAVRPDIRILYQPGKGKPDALLHGFRNATGDIIVTLDADGATDPAVMQQFVMPLLQGYEFVKGSRFRTSTPEGMSGHRKFGNRALVTLANILYGTRHTDLCSGYNAFWRDALKKLRLPDKFDCDVLIHLRVTKVKLKCQEVAHHDPGRSGGSSKMASFREGYRILKVILKERFSGINQSKETQ